MVLFARNGQAAPIVQLLPTCRRPSSHQETNVQLHQDLGAVLLGDPPGLHVDVAEVDWLAIEHHTPPHLAAGNHLEIAM